MLFTYMPIPVCSGAHVTRKGYGFAIGN